MIYGAETWGFGAQTVCCGAETGVNGAETGLRYMNFLKIGAETGDVVQRQDM